MTFSIVARDPGTGAFGVATVTAGPAVGALVPHGASGVGAIATQAMTNPYLAFDGLEYLKTMSAADALERALEDDPLPARRQAIFIDRDGEIGMWTGDACQPWAGHKAGDNVAVAGNIIAGGAVLDAMLAAFADEAELPYRLLAALSAGNAAGGDRRGATSGAIKVFGAESYPAVDIRIDWSDEPIADLASLLDRTLAGEYANFFSQVLKRPG
jgi:uncharacterized Ntn-hydrolase superfamily protein